MSPPPVLVAEAGKRGDHFGNVRRDAEPASDDGRRWARTMALG
jgi:hypothetical protein